MTRAAFNQRPGDLEAGHTLRLQRRLPGPIERVWDYLTRSELRQQWLASGVMEDLRPGASFELVWRNDELSDSPAERPEGFSAESRATCTVLAAQAPRLLRYRWPDVGEVCFELAAVGDEVLMTITHSGLAGERLLLNVCAGWHAHLARMVALVEGQRPPSLWATWTLLRADYARRLQVTA